MKEAQSTVFVVDDDPSVRKALKRLLSSAGHAVETFVSADEFLDNNIHGRSGCIVLDVKMPGTDGLELQKRFLQQEVTLPIVFITGHGDLKMGVGAMKNGAVDFLSKPVNDVDLLHAVEEGLRRADTTLNKKQQLHDVKQRFDRLTPREKEVFALVTEGLLNKQVGFKLSVTEKTVKAHRGQVMKKMEAGSLPELVRLAEKLGVSYKAAG